LRHANFLARIKAHGLTHHCGTLYALTIDDRFRWTAMALLLNPSPLSQTIVNVQPRTVFTPVAKICERIKFVDIGEHGMEAYSGFLKEVEATGFSSEQSSIGRF
jgi:hypothetical protein